MNVVLQFLSGRRIVDMPGVPCKGDSVTTDRGTYRVVEVLWADGPENVGPDQTWYPVLILTEGP